MITLRGVLLFIFGLSLSLAAIFLQNPFLALLGISTIFLFTFANYHFEWDAQSLKISSQRTFSMGKVGVSQPVECTVSISLSRNLPFTYHDVIPAFFESRGSRTGKATASTSFIYSLSSASRGLFDIGPTKITINDASGLFTRDLVPPNASQLLVYPSLGDVKKYDMQMRRRTNVQLQGIRKGIAQGPGTDFIALRKYAPGDELRQIDWKATARTRQLMVRTFQAEKKQRIFILLDSGRLMHAGSGVSMLDAGINTAVLLSHVVLKRGDLLGFATFSDKLEFFLKPGNNRAHFYRMLDALARIRPQKETDFIASFKQLSPLLRKRSLVIIISSLHDGGQKQIVEAIKMLKAHRHAIVVIAPFEPWFEPIAAKERLVKVIADLAEEKYRKDLNQIASAVKRFGVSIIPVGPQDMTKASLQKYAYAVNEGLATI